MSPGNMGGFESVIQHEGITFDLQEMLFIELPDEGSRKLLRLQVVVPRFRDEDREKFRRGVLKSLDVCLGEKVASIDISRIDVCGMPVSPEGYDESEYIDESGYFRFADLGSYIDWWEYRLSKKT